MVTIDTSKCIHCGICLESMGGYCLHDNNGVISIDYSICSECQKCIAICPKQAFLQNGEPPVKIEKPVLLNADDLEVFLQKRRSIKRFKNQPIPPGILEKIAIVGQYAPAMNKEIEVIIVDKKEILDQIDHEALEYVKSMYNLLFKSRLVYSFIRLFAKTLPVIKRKMERDLFEKKQIIKKNTQALILLTGSTKIPVTESSAQFYLANMVFYSEAIGLGSCLMDSLKLALNSRKALKKALKIPKGHKVLGVLSLGYPDEKIVNIPRGGKIKIGWNGA